MKGIKRWIEKRTPQAILAAYRWQRTSKIFQKAGASLVCPICNFSGQFVPEGLPPRFNAMCPSCDSLERHRLFFLALKDGLLAANGYAKSGPILHFAAEKSIEKYFRNNVANYATADLSQKADMQLNIENMDVASDSYQTVIANHVLEHVDDSAASKEIFRILRPRGLFLAMVPIIEGWDRTYENAEITDAHGRSAHFGQHDHVRYYGRDFKERISASGLRLEKEITADGIDSVKYGLIRGDKVFVFVKPDKDEAS